MPTKTTVKTTTRKPPIRHATDHPEPSGSGPELSTMPGPTERFASVEQQEQFLRRALLTGKEPTDDLPEAHIEEVIDKDLDPPDSSGPDEPPPNKGKGRAEGKCPNNNLPDGGDDGNGPGSSDDSSNNSDGSNNNNSGSKSNNNSNRNNNSGKNNAGKKNDSSNSKDLSSKLGPDSPPRRSNVG